MANERMRRDLNAAAKIQRALLPTTLPEVRGVRFAWTFKPCEELAGDILNVVRLDDRHVGLYVLDVCGHGVASALLSVTVSRFLSTVPDSSSLLLRKDEGATDYTLVPAAEVAAQLNRRFLFSPATEQYFTMVYGILDLESRQFRYISAGHPPLVHVPADAPATILEAPGFPIGITIADYEEHMVHLKPGDRLFLYSDGIVEAKDDRQRHFGTRGLADFLDEGQGRPPRGDRHRPAGGRRAVVGHRPAPRRRLDPGRGGRGPPRCRVLNVTLRRGTIDRAEAQGEADGMVRRPTPARRPGRCRGPCRGR